MNKTISIYQTLNEREKYILEKLEIREKDLVPEYANSVLSVMHRMTGRISELPLTNEQVLSAIKNFDQSKEIFFKGIDFIATEDDYPNIKLNVYKTLSDKTKETLKILDIKVEDKEMTAKEYAEISNVLINKMLIKYGTGIKKKECMDLTNKITGLLILNIL